MLQTSTNLNSDKPVDLGGHRSLPLHVTSKPTFGEGKVELEQNPSQLMELLYLEQLYADKCKVLWLAMSYYKTDKKHNRKLIHTSVTTGGQYQLQSMLDSGSMACNFRKEALGSRCHL